MGHSFYKIWIHLVFSTKNREPLLYNKIRPVVFKYMRDKLNEDLGCPVRIINGIADHVHVLFLLNPKRSLSEVIKNLKGGSSHWINQQNICQQPFAWQTGYAAFSVSESQLEKVFEYINNQETHHQKISFEQEFDRFLELNKVSNNNN